MLRECGPGQWVEFRLTDRAPVVWPSTGLTAAAVVTARLETGAWFPLSFTFETGELLGLFAGPDNTTPAGAVVINGTSHVDIHIVDGDVDRIMDGGFIRLVS